MGEPSSGRETQSRCSQSHISWRGPRKAGRTRAERALQGSFVETNPTYQVPPEPTITSVLKKVDILRGLTDDDLKKIAMMAEPSRVLEGEVLGKARAMGQDLFVLVSGEAQVSAASSVGEVAVRVAQPGDVFPMAALVGHGRLITSGEALTDLVVLKIPSSGLMKLCTEKPAIGMRIYRNIAESFAQRYARTLDHLNENRERVLREAGFFADMLVSKPG